MSELLPCPFCGSERMMAYSSVYGCILCASCGTRGPIIDNNGTRWNTRAELTALKSEIPSEAFKAGVQKNIDDMMEEQRNLYRKNQSLAAELSALKSDPLREAEREVVEAAEWLADCPAQLDGAARPEVVCVSILREKWLRIIDALEAHHGLRAARQEKP